MIREPAKTLFIEDDDKYAFAIGSVLIDAPCFDYQIKVTPSLRSAVAMLKAEAFDLVILDLKLPDAQGMDGIVAIRSVAPDVVLVVLTGTGDRDLENAAYRENVSDYIPKIGLPNGEILNRIRTAVVSHFAGRRFHRMDCALDRAAAVDAKCASNPALPPYPDAKV